MVCNILSKAPHPNPPRSRGGKRVAFTLAEVLITLGIIGVVAALTIPSLMTKIEDMIFASKAKKVWADLNNSLRMVSIDYDAEGNNSALFSKENTRFDVAKIWARYINGATVCEYPPKKGCEDYEIKFARARKDEAGLAVVDRSWNPKILFPNGAAVFIDNFQTACLPRESTGVQKDDRGVTIKNPDGTDKTYTYISDNCGDLRMDVNGPDGPNQYGRDVFFITVLNDKIQVRTDAQFGGKNFQNIINGNKKIEYEKYSKGDNLN